MLKKTLFILCVIHLNSCDFRTPEDYYDLAYDLVELGKYDEAITLLDKGIEKQPNFRPGLLQRGFCNMQIENYLGAIKDFKKILSFDKDNTLALYNLGVCHYNLKNYGKSIQNFTLALDTDGSKSNSLIDVELVMNGDVDNDSNYTVYDNEIRFDRASAYFKNNDFKNATIDLKKVLQTGYKLAESNYWLAESYLGLKDTAMACEKFKKSVELGFTESKELRDEVCFN